MSSSEISKTKIKKRSALNGGSRLLYYGVGRISPIHNKKSCPVITVEPIHAWYLQKKVFFSFYALSVQVSKGFDTRTQTQNSEKSSNFC